MHKSLFTDTIQDIHIDFELTSCINVNNLFVFLSCEESCATILGNRLDSGGQPKPLDAILVGAGWKGGQLAQVIVNICVTSICLGPQRVLMDVEC